MFCSVSVGVWFERSGDIFYRYGNEEGIASI